MNIRHLSFNDYNSYAIQVVYFEELKILYCEKNVLFCLAR